MKSRFWNRPAVNGRKMIFEALEERIVMDAAVDHALHGNSFTHHQTHFGPTEDPRAFYGISSALVGEEWLHRPVPQASAVHEPAPIASAPQEAAHPAPAVPHKAAPASHSGLDVILIQDSLEGKDAIAAAASPDAKVVFYSAEKDNLDSINAKLGDLVSSTGKKIEHLAVAGHGEKDTLIIGSEQINLSNASEHRPEFKALAQNLAPHAQVQFYNCSVAADALGEALVDRVAVMTGAQVFASSDTTGAKPGNWTLEYASDPKASLLPVFDADKLSQVPGHLAQAAVTTLQPNDNIDDAFRHPAPGQPALPLVPQVGGLPIFSATDGPNGGYEVYRSTALTPAAGQAALSNLAPFNSHIHELTSVGNNGYFVGVPVPATGAELYRADAIPTPMSDFGNGWNGFDPEIAHVTQVGQSLFLIGHQPANITPLYPAGGFEVWRSLLNQPVVNQVTDGTGAGTAGNVSQFNALNGYTDGNPSLSEPTSASDGLSMYFVGNSPGTTGVALVLQGYEVWRSDGATPVGLLDGGGNPVITDFGATAGNTERGAISAFGDQALIGRYDPNIYDLVAARDNSKTLYFVANEPGIGNEIWRSDGGVPNVVGGERTNNANGDRGNVTAFPNDNPDIQQVTSVPGPGGAFAKRIYFVATSDATNYRIWRSDGGGTNNLTQITDQGNLPVVNPFTVSDPEISQLTAAANGDMFFVANSGAAGTPNYEVMRINNAGAMQVVTDFPDAAIVPPATPGAIDPLDPVEQTIPAHTNPHIRLVTIVGNNLWFEADSLNNQARELYSVDLTQATPQRPAQRTNFGYDDVHFGYLTDDGGNLAFVAQTTTSEQIFTINNSAPQVTSGGGLAVGSAAAAPFVTGLEDNNNHNTPISLPNAIRIGDADMNNNPTVTVTPTAGFSAGTGPDGTAFPALGLTAVGNAAVSAPAGDGSRTITVPAPIDPWTAQRDINLTLATLQAYSNLDTHTDGFPVTPHTITVTVNDNTGQPNAQVIQPVGIGVLAVNDQPQYNPTGSPNVFPGIVPGVGTNAGPAAVPSNAHLVFDGVVAPPTTTTVHAPLVIASDVDAYEILGAGNVPNNGVITINVMAGAGTVTMPNRLVAGLPLSGQNLTFSDTIGNINTALNSMVYTAPAYFVGPTNITVTLDDANPYVPTPHTGQLESGAPVTLTPPAGPGVTQFYQPAYRPALGVIPISVTTPAGGFFGRLYDSP